MASKPRRRRSVSATRPPDDAWGSSDSEDEAPFSSVSALIALFNCTIKQTANYLTRVRLTFPPPITFKTLPYPLIRVCSIHNPHLRRRLSLILFSRPTSIPLVKVRFVVCLSLLAPLSPRADSTSSAYKRKIWACRRITTVVSGRNTAYAYKLGRADLGISSR